MIKRFVMFAASFTKVIDSSALPNNNSIPNDDWQDVEGNEE